MASAFLDQYESLDIIGNGSFGIIRKVRRKSDGIIFARKELNFERMSERDRKQIVAEVNILKDLHHDHIVRYHDRYVDRDAGILYILMEYCGGGDLSTVIKQSMKQNRPIPEDLIWNYFMQILLALHYCHHPNGHGRTPSSSAVNFTTSDNDGKERRAQILHRDLKPDNVFLDENNTVKLGDFGLSKALPQASFANTYVGTPYYMSPELMQEKAYDSKSDIWSLGCLIYELCAWKPPFHEAKTHSELSIFIRNGRIPPLPRGYSQALTGIIKSMLNLNPAMRPSAAQLLQHERLELVLKFTETEKMLSTVKIHKTTVANKERELHSREQALLEKEQHIISMLAHKDNEIANLQSAIAQFQHYYSPSDVERAVKQAIAEREEELRLLVMKREEEVGAAMAKREEEIMEAVRQREAEVCEAWAAREGEIQNQVQDNIKSVEERVEWINRRESELQVEEMRLENLREEIESKLRQWEEKGARKGKTPLEEVKNLLEPLARLSEATPSQARKPEFISPKPISSIASLKTPISRATYNDYIPSAMKGVVLTATGETLATPTPAEVAKLFNSSPKVGLNFTNIFDPTVAGTKKDEDTQEELDSPPPSPSTRKERERDEREREREKEDGSDSGTSSGSSTKTVVKVVAPPTRLRRPSIRSSSKRPGLSRVASLPSSTSDPIGLSTTARSSQPKPLPHPHLQTQSTLSAATTTVVSAVAPEYDLADEENLPSPFLRRREKSTVKTGVNSEPAIGTVRMKKRSSGGNILRAVAAANNAGRRVPRGSESLSGCTTTTTSSAGTCDGTTSARPSLTTARKAGEEARKALMRS